MYTLSNTGFLILQGRTFGLISLIAILFVNEYARRGALQGDLPQIRKIAAIDAIEEVVGRAAEMGGKIHTGIGDFARIHTEYAPQVIAALAISGYTAKICARLGVPIIATTMYGETLPLLDETIEEAYRVEGKLEDFRRENVRFIAGSQLPYCAGVFEMMTSENVVGQVLTGPWAYATVLIGEYGHQAGAVQIGGTARTVMMPGFVAIYDYYLIGEELFAAAAMITQDPAKMASITAQDYGKLGTLVLFVLGIIFSLVGSQLILNLIKW